MRHIKITDKIISIFSPVFNWFPSIHFHTDAHPLSPHIFFCFLCREKHLVYIAVTRGSLLGIENFDRSSVIIVQPIVAMTNHNLILIICHYIYRAVRIWWMFWCITAAGLNKTKCRLPTLYNGEKGQYHPEQDGNVDHTDHLTGTIRVMQTRHGQDIHCKQ